MIKHPSRSGSAGKADDSVSSGHEFESRRWLNSISGFSFYKWSVQGGKAILFSSKKHEQTIIEFSQGD
jgi:hypothetical protein